MGWGDAWRGSALSLGIIACNAISGTDDLIAVTPRVDAGASSSSGEIMTVDACANGARDGTETDIDCGGTCSRRCDEGKTCVTNTDCGTAFCKQGVCAAIGCGDGAKNGTETDVDCGGSCPSCARGKACVASADCDKGVCTANVCAAPKSCAERKVQVPAAATGVYTLDPDGSGPVAAFDAYCDMEGDGGGWTLALKADGTQATFAYAATIWTDGSVLAPDKPALDAVQAKLSSFNTIAFTSVRVGIQEPAATTVRWLVIPQAGTSLTALFTPGVHLPSTLGRAAWKGLLPGSSLQLNCNAEGLNVRLAADAWVRVRVGLLGNQEANCTSPDSMIGIGGAGTQCALTAPAAGNMAAAACGADNGDKLTRTFGYLMVR